MSQNYHSIWVHAIWSTKLRSPLINRKIKFILLSKIKDISTSKGYHLDHINCVEDHVHCLIYLKPNHALSNVIKDLKGGSSHWMNEEQIIDEHFQWQDGYSAFSVSRSMPEKIRLYIQNQEEHHKTIDYQKELNDLIS